MSTIGGDGPRLTVSLAQVDDLRLENRAMFKSPEERVAFLDAIKNAREQEAKGVLNPTLEIPQPVNAQSLGLVADKFNSSAILVGGTLLDVMTILHEIGQQLRQTAKESRAVAREAEVDKLHEAADKIRQGAMFALASGVTSGVMTIGGGLMSGMGAAKGANTTMKGIQAANAAHTTTPTSQLTNQPTLNQTPTTNVGSSDVRIGGHRSNVVNQSSTTTTTGDVGRPRSNAISQPPGSQVPGSNSGTPSTVSDTRTGQSQKQSMLASLRDKLLDSDATKVAVASKSVEVSSTLGNMQMQKWMATGTMMQGAGQIMGAGFDSAAKFMDAARADLEADAKMFGYQAQEQDEIVQKMLELMRDVRQKLGEIEQAQSQVQSKIWS